MITQAGYCTLDNLPTEIHHVIFSYLDYIRDICCNSLFSVPYIEMPINLHDFEQLHDMEKEQDENPPTTSGRNEVFIDFDMPKIPFFLACRSLMHSMQLFKPNALNLSIFSYKRVSRFATDDIYLSKLFTFPWFKGQPVKDYHFSNTEWMRLFREFVRRMRMLCGTDPFSRVEFVSFSNRVGRNYSTNGYHDTPHDFYQIFNLIPSFKYALFNYSPYFADKRILNSLTIIHTTCSDYYASNLTQNNNEYCIAMEYERKPALPVEQLKQVFPNNYPTNMEYILFNCILSRNEKEANYIIENFKLDVNLFSFIWNIRSNIQKKLHYDHVKQIMDLLNSFYKKYPTFRLFKFPIDRVKWLKLILTYPFVDINPSKNITKTFLEKLDGDKVKSLALDYNINLSKLGTYQFSAACLVSSTNLTIEKDTPDIFGISASLFTLVRGSNIYGRDKFGNNILHYLYMGARKDDIAIFLSKLSEDEIKILGRESNVFGITANEIALLKGCNIVVESFSKKLNFHSFTQTFGNFHCFRLSLFDGLVMNEKMYCSFLDNLQIDKYNYDEYRDINYRDENGKHLFHYSQNCFSEQFKHFDFDLKDVVFCKDINQTIPLQNCYKTYLFVLDNLGKIENLPKFNFFEYTDDFGMYRYLYLLNHFANIELLVKEADTIAFDYSSGQPEIVSLCSHYIDGHYHFTIDKSPLKQLKNIRYYGTVDGDDFSHFILRFYLNNIIRHPYYVDWSIINSLVARGLQFDIIRNSQGETAFDLIEKFGGNQIIMTTINHLRKICRRGLTKKSKAIRKFSIKHNPIPDEILIHDAETKLIVKSNVVSQFRVRIKRTLIFKNK